MAIGTLDTYLIDGEQKFDEAAKAERWYLTFAIPRVDWPDDWNILPARGAEPLEAFPAKLNVGGTCLKRKVSLTERDGWAIVRAVYGYDIAILAEDKAVVTMHTIMVKMKIEYAYTNATPPVKTLVSGTKFTADGQAVGKHYDITPGQGYDRYVEVPFQQVRITAILTEAGLETYGGAMLFLASGLNSASWTLLDKSIVAERMMYRGLTTSIYRNSPGSAILYRADFDFLIHPYGWKRSLKRTEYETAALQVPAINDAGDVEGKKNVKGKKVAAAGNEATLYYYRPTANFGAILADLLT